MLGPLTRALRVLHRALRKVVHRVGLSWPVVSHSPMGIPGCHLAQGSLALGQTVKSTLVMEPLDVGVCYLQVVDLSGMAIGIRGLHGIRDLFSTEMGATNRLASPSPEPLDSQGIPIGLNRVFGSMA